MGSEQERARWVERPTTPPCGVQPVACVCLHGHMGDSTSLTHGAEEEEPAKLCPLCAFVTSAYGRPLTSLSFVCLRARDDLKLVLNAGA